MSEQKESNVMKVESIQNIEQLMKTVNKMKVDDVDLVSTYHDFEIGEAVRIVPVGIQKINRVGGEGLTDSIKFILASNGETYISADAVIVSTLRASAEKTERGEGVYPVEVVCTGEASSPKGKYKTFSIKKLY